MSKPDIEVLDDAQGYPYSSHISVDGMEVQYDDLLLVFESSESLTVNFFERVYGFNWSGVITHLIDGPLPAEFREFERFAEGLESGKIVVVPGREKASFFVGDDTIRTLTLYRHLHQDGMQPIIVDERRNPGDQKPHDQAVTLCENLSDITDELFVNNPPSTADEGRQIREFLLSVGYKESRIPDPTK
jgi:hypothetical protein